MSIQTKPLTGQCPHCGAPAWRLAYHSRYTLRSGQIVLVFRCRQCRKTFCDRFGTAFYDLKTPEEKVQRAIQQGLEGLCPEAVARVEGVHPTTIQRWVDRACVQAKAADKEVITDVSTQNIEQHWTHVAMARESRLMLEVVVGPRTQESATELVEGAARRLASDCWPLWSSDGWEPYLFALTVVFAVLIHFIKGKGRGRPKESQVVPDPRVRYGQVIKQRAGRRLVAVTRRVIFGVEELIPLKQISTSLLERLNGTIRQHVAPLHRKTRSFAKCRTALDTQLSVKSSLINVRKLTIGRYFALQLTPEMVHRIEFRTLLWQPNQCYVELGRQLPTRPCRMASRLIYH